MRENFKITGLFYQKAGYNFRKFLNIIRNDTNRKIPDLMVVMMNPGSSRPFDGNENSFIETEAIPDKTQDQIMKIMNECGFDFARILNLSDLREAKSSVFYKKIEELNTKKISHSIFDMERNDDFQDLFVQNVPVIFAWGVNKYLFKLAKMAIERVGSVNPIGLRKNSFEFAYYHPLPRFKNEREEWVDKIIKIFKENHNQIDNSANNI